ncbi:MAG TPA: exosome protein [Candidatus Methanomethylia archaeon]|nr:exosome protein [Candidatus Methanomethylicia archaeon]
MSMAIYRAQLETIIHATESPEKVKTAVLNLLPPELRERVCWEETPLEGHYGNPITLLKAGFSGEDSRKLMKWLAEKLGQLDKELLKGKLDLHYDRAGILYLRFNKQQAYLGKVELSEGEDVIKARFSISLPKRNLAALRKLLKEEGLI